MILAILPLALARPTHLDFAWEPGDRATVSATVEADGATWHDEWSVRAEAGETQGSLRVVVTGGTGRVSGQWAPASLTLDGDARPTGEVDREPAALWESWVGRWIGRDLAKNDMVSEEHALAAPTLGWRVIPTLVTTMLADEGRCGATRRPRCVELRASLTPDPKEAVASFQTLMQSHPEIGRGTVTRAATTDVWRLWSEPDTLRPHLVTLDRLTFVMLADGGKAEHNVHVTWEWTWAPR